MPVITIVLAGGKSYRFNGNKYLYPINGIPVICRVLSAVSTAPSVSETWLVVERKEQGIVYVEECGMTLRDVEIIEDDKGLSCEGPARGIATALTESSHRMLPELLFLPGDAAWIKPSILVKLIEQSRHQHADAASPWWREGVIENMFLYLRVPGSITTLYLDLCGLKKKHTRVTDVLRLVDRLVLIPGETLGEPLGLATINTYNDALYPKPKGAPGAPLKVIDWGPSGAPLISVLDSLKKMNIKKAYNQLINESKIWLSKGVLHLAHHAAVDAIIIGSASGINYEEALILADNTRF